MQQEGGRGERERGGVRVAQVLLFSPALGIHYPGSSRVSNCYQVTEREQRSMLPPPPARLTQI